MINCWKGGAQCNRHVGHPVVTVRRHTSMSPAGCPTKRAHRDGVHSCCCCSFGHNRHAVRLMLTVSLPCQHHNSSQNVHTEMVSAVVEALFGGDAEAVRTIFSTSEQIWQICPLCVLHWVGWLGLGGAHHLRHQSAMCQCRWSLGVSVSAVQTVDSLSSGGPAAQSFDTLKPLPGGPTARPRLAAYSPSLSQCFPLFRW